MRGPFWILLDGQRSEAFHQRWEEGPTEPAAKHLLTALPERVSREAWWAPEAFAPKAEAVLPARRIRLEDEGAATLAGLVALARRVSQRSPEAPLVPFYLRETDAAVNFPLAAAHLSEALRKGVAR